VNLNKILKIDIIENEHVRIYRKGVLIYDDMDGVVKKGINKVKERKPIDWGKPLQITTNNGTFKVYNLGIGWKDKRLVQIEECSARFPDHDGSLPNVFNPDESGYVVQFDRWIENEPEIKNLYLNEDYAYRFGTIRLEMWPEGLVLWVGGGVKWKSWS
jgi:hypothetical protein